MIKRVCINEYVYYLTIGKVYDIIYIGVGGHYCLKDDNGVNMFYVPSKMFISLEEYRNNKINQIINE